MANKKTPQDASKLFQKVIKASVKPKLEIPTKPDLASQAFIWNGLRANKWQRSDVQDNWIGVVIKWWIKGKEGEQYVLEQGIPKKIHLLGHAPYAYATDNVRELYQSKNFQLAHVILTKTLKEAQKLAAQFNKEFWGE